MVLATPFPRNISNILLIYTWSDWIFLDQGLRMASGVAVPEVTVPKPTISFAPKSESETTTRPEDKVRDRKEIK